MKWDLISKYRKSIEKRVQNYVKKMIAKIENSIYFSISNSMSTQYRSKWSYLFGGEIVFYQISSIDLSNIWSIFEFWILNFPIEKFIKIQNPIRSGKFLKIKTKLNLVKHCPGKIDQLCSFQFEPWAFVKLIATFSN